MRKNMYIGIFLGIEIFLMAVILFYISGYRLAPMSAAQANSNVGKDSVSFGNVDFEWGKVYLFKTPKGTRTVVVIESGFLWRSTSAVPSDQVSVEAIKTVGLVSHNDEKRQATVLAVETFDLDIVFIEAGPIGMRTTKEVKAGEPIIFSWDKAIKPSDLKPLALTANGVPLYEYRHPENTNTIGNDNLNWYSADTALFSESRDVSSLIKYTGYIPVNSKLHSNYEEGRRKYEF